MVTPIKDVLRQCLAPLAQDISELMLVNLSYNYVAQADSLAKTLGETKYPMCSLRTTKHFDVELR